MNEHQFIFDMQLSQPIYDQESNKVYRNASFKLNQEIEDALEHTLTAQEEQELLSKQIMDGLKELLKPKQESENFSGL